MNVSPFLFGFTRFGLLFVSLTTGLTVWSTIATSAQSATPAAQPSDRPLLLAQATTSTVLRRGDSGEAVTRLQRQLASLGYFQGQATGLFGSQTEAAVIRFQESNGLRADGIVGSSTQAALQRASRGSTATNNATGNRSANANPARSNTSRDSAIATTELKFGDRGEEVTALQTRLTELGYYDGPISGVFAEQTRVAVREFQRDQELISNGVVDTDTQEALQQATRSPRTGTTASTPTPSNRSTDVDPAVVLPGSATTPVPATGSSNGQMVRVPDISGDIAGRANPTLPSAIEQGMRGPDTSSNVSGRVDPSLPSAIEQGMRGPDTSSNVSGRVDPSLPSAIAPMSPSARSASGFPLEDLPPSRGATPPIVQPRSLPPIDQPNLEPLPSPSIQPPAGRGLPPIIDGSASMGSRSFDGNAQSFGAPSSSNVLRQGDRGPAVGELQSRLRNLRFFNGEITQYFGTQTDAAVRNFQRSRGLRVDGVVGRETASALGLSGNVVDGGGGSWEGDRISVVQLQQRLQQRGFYNGPLDGRMGPQTRAAIRAAQRQYGVSEQDIAQGRF